MNWSTTAVVAGAAVLLVLGAAAPVAAAMPAHADNALQEEPGDGEEEDDEDDGDTIIRLDLDELTDIINEFMDKFDEFEGSFDERIQDILLAVFFHPFRQLALELLRILVVVLTTAPAVYPNPAVARIHALTLNVAVLLSTLAFIAAGVLHMIGPVFGVSYREARLILPRIALALIFAAVAPRLLQHAVDLSNLLVEVFQPPGLNASLTQVSGVSSALVLVYVINAWLLLAAVVIFIIRGVYILFATAIAPLIALAWAVPPTKRYADKFIGGFWTAIAMGPLDVLVLRFNFALMNGSSVSHWQFISNWVYGVAGFTLLIIIPIQLYGASQMAVGQSYLIARGVKRRVRQYYRNRGGSDTSSDRDRIPRKQAGSDEDTPARQRSNKFDYDFGDDDDD